MEKSDSASKILLTDLAAQKGSVRLRNVLLRAELNRSLPATTVGEFLALKPDPASHFLKLPDMGKKSLTELKSLVYQVVNGRAEQSYGPEYSYTSDLFTQLDGQGQKLGEKGSAKIYDIVKKYSQNNRLINALSADDECYYLNRMTLGEWESQPEWERKTALLKIRGLGVTSYTALKDAILEYKQAENPALHTSTRDSDENIHNVIDKAIDDYSDLEEEYSEILEKLKHREQTVLELRYKKLYTLQDVGDTLGLTRERIRQIEKKSLEKISKQLHLHDIKIIKDIIFNKFWGELSCGQPYVLKLSQREIEEKVPFLTLVLSDAIFGSIASMVESYCDTLNNIWTYGVDIAETERVKSMLDGSFVYFSNAPTPISLIAQYLRVSVEAAHIAVIDSPGYALHRGHVLDRPITKRKRRFVSVCQLLGVTYSSGPTRLMDLHDSYLSLEIDDQCSTRDLLLTLKDNPTVFQRAGSYGWFLLRNFIPFETHKTGNVFTADEDRDTAQDYYQDSSLVSVLIEILSERPLPYREIHKEVKKVSGIKYSKGSVPALLATYPEFDFFAPGLIGLYQKRKDAEYLNEGKRYLFEPLQIRQYILAQKAGRPELTYSCWDFSFEEDLLGYLQEKNLKAELGSLVQSILDRPDSRYRKDYSRLNLLLNEYGGRVDLPNWVDLSLEVIKPEHVVRAALIVFEYGFLNWMVANRISGDRLDSYRRGPSLINLLVGLRVIRPTPLWFDSHVIGDQAFDMTLSLMNVFVSSDSSLFWSFILEKIKSTGIQTGYSASHKSELIDQVSNIVWSYESSDDTSCSEDEEVGSDRLRDIDRDELNDFLSSELF